MAKHPLIKTEVRAEDGRLLGIIEKCSCGSRFVQVKRVPRGMCVNCGTAHVCKGQ